MLGTGEKLEFKTPQALLIEPTVKDAPEPDEHIKLVFSGIVNSYTDEEARLAQLAIQDASRGNLINLDELGESLTEENTHTPPLKEATQPSHTPAFFPAKEGDVPQAQLEEKPKQSSPSV